MYFYLTASAHTPQSILTTLALSRPRKLRGPFLTTRCFKSKNVLSGTRFARKIRIRYTSRSFLKRTHGSNPRGLGFTEHILIWIIPHRFSIGPFYWDGCFVCDDPKFTAVILNSGVESRFARTSQTPILPCSITMGKFWYRCLQGNNIPIVTKGHSNFQMSLEMDGLEHNRRIGLEPSVLLSLKPIVNTFLQGIELFQWGAPGDLHRQILVHFTAAADVSAGINI